MRLEVAGVSTEVVVTAADAPQTVDEVSKAVTVVGRRELEDRDEATIAEALRTVPGLRVQQLGGPGALTSIKTRGLRSQDTSLLVDGLRFRDPAAAQGDATSFLADFTVTDAGRVEVLRGSGSSLYGTNALGGVVNVVTDEGGGPFHGQLFAEGGGLGFLRGRAQVAGSAGGAERVVYSAAVSHLNVSRGVDGEDELQGEREGPRRRPRHGGHCPTGPSCALPAARPAEKGAPRKRPGLRRSDSRRRPGRRA